MQTINHKLIIMKKVVLSVFIPVVIINSKSNAQTLNQSTHAPAVGDVYTFQYADPATLPSNLGNPGTGNTFNFSGLSVYTGNKTSNGVTVASTGSASAYPNANVAVQTGTDNTFYDAQSNKLDFYGGNLTLGGYPITFTYTTPATLGLYPMTLGTTSSGTIAGNIFGLGNSGNFVGTSSFTADATGTLVVPGGNSYNDVMRINIQQNMTFTISFVQGTLTVNQYDYYAPNYSNFPNPNNNWPLISVQQSTLSSSIGGTSIQTTVTINSNYQTLSIDNNLSMAVHFSEFQILPNPANDNIQIYSLHPIKNIEIFDITGKSITQLSPRSSVVNFDCENLQNGVYFVRSEDEEGNVSVKKLVIQH